MLGPWGGEGDRCVSQPWGSLQHWPPGAPTLTPLPRGPLTVPGAGLASSGAAFLTRQAGIQAARTSAFRTQKSSSTSRPCRSARIREGTVRVHERPEQGREGVS